MDLRLDCDLFGQLFLFFDKRWRVQAYSRDSLIFFGLLGKFPLSVNYSGG